jgi:ATP-dependent DNA helicase RecQ
LVALRAVSGFGDKKVERYGQEILETLQRFQNGDRAKNDAHAAAAQPREDTLQLLGEGRTFEEIAQIRFRKVSSVISLVVKLIEEGELKFEAKWLGPERYAQIAAAIEQFGNDRLKPVKEALPEEITYEEIRLVAAHLRLNAKSKMRRSRIGNAPRCSPS